MRKGLVCMIALLLISGCVSTAAGEIRVVSGKPGMLCACYGGGSENLTQLVQQSDIIVLGEVEKQYDFGEYSIISEVRILRISKGVLATEVIKILQLNDGYILKQGEKYLLALESQPLYGDDIFAIKGGVQGVFWEKNQAIEVFVPDFVEEISSQFRAKKISFSISNLADLFEKLSKN